MIAAELRGGTKPSLNEALGWIGSRVDDIYGASVGRLEDVWIDPGTGVPRWLLVKEGRFGGRSTLVPFEDATAGAGHVWVPYEREIVRGAPEIEPGAPLTQQVEASLRSHYAANVPAAFSHGGQPVDSPPGPQPGSAMGTATVRFATGPAEAGTPSALGFDPDLAPQPQPQPQHLPRRHVLREGPQPASQPSAPHLQGVPPAPPPARPAPPIAAPEPPAYSPPPVATPQPAAPQGWQQAPPAQQGWQIPFGAPPVEQPQPQPSTQQPPPQAPPVQEQAFQPPPMQQQAFQQPMPMQPPPASHEPPMQPSPIDALTALASSAQVHYVEIELSGELRISGDLRSIRVVPREPGRDSGQ